MFRAGLLLIIRRCYAVYTALVYVMLKIMDFHYFQHDIYQLLYIQSSTG